MALERWRRDLDERWDLVLEAASVVGDDWDLLARKALIRADQLERFYKDNKGKRTKLGDRVRELDAAFADVEVRDTEAAKASPQVLYKHLSAKNPGRWATHQEQAIAKKNAVTEGDIAAACAVALRRADALLTGHLARNTELGRLEDGPRDLKEAESLALFVVKNADPEIVSRWRKEYGPPVSEANALIWLEADEDQQETARELLRRPEEE